MKVYTKTGDTGMTSLLGGERVGKDHARVSAYGDIDELNAVLGWIAGSVGDELQEPLFQIQRWLFALGAELATANPTAVSRSVQQLDEAGVAQLETWIDEATAALSPLTQFILPGGTEGAARLHIGRVVCRRTERAVVHLAHHENVRPVVLQFLNRLSDLLFTWARWVNHRQGHGDTPWKASS